MNCVPKELNLNMAPNSHRQTSETSTPKKKPLHELPIFKKINESILQLDNLVNIPLVYSKAQSGSSNVKSGTSNVQSQRVLGPAVTSQRFSTQLKFTETLQGQSIPQREQHPPLKEKPKVFPVRQSSEQKPHTTINYRKSFSFMKHTEKSFQTVTRMPKMRPNAKPKLFASKNDTGFIFQTGPFDSQHDIVFTSQSNTNLNFNQTSETWINSTQYNVQQHSYSQFGRNNSSTKNQNNAFVKIERTSKPQPPVDRGGPKSYDSKKYLPTSRPIIPPTRPSTKSKPKLFYSKSDIGFNSQTDMFDSQSDTEFTSQNNTNLNFSQTFESWIDSNQCNVQPYSYSQFERNNSSTKNQNNTVLKIKRTTKHQPSVDQGGPKSFGSYKYLPKIKPIIPPPRPHNTKPKVFYSKNGTGFYSRSETFDSQSDTLFGERCSSFNFKELKMDNFRKSFSFRENSKNHTNAVPRCVPMIKPRIPPPPPPNVKLQLPDSKNDYRFNLKNDRTCETNVNQTYCNTSPSSSHCKESANPTRSLSHTIMKFEKTSIFCETPKCPPPKHIVVSQKSRRIRDLIDCGRFESLNPDVFKTGITRDCVGLQRGLHSPPEREKKKNGIFKSIQESFNKLKKNTCVYVKNGPPFVVGKNNFTNKTVTQLQAASETDLKTRGETSYGIPVSHTSQIKETLKKNQDGLVVMSPELLYTLLSPAEDKGGFKDNSEKSTLTRYAPTAPPYDSF